MQELWNKVSKACMNLLMCHLFNRHSKDKLEKACIGDKERILEYINIFEVTVRHVIVDLGHHEDLPSPSITIIPDVRPAKFIAIAPTTENMLPSFMVV